MENKRFNLIMKQAEKLRLVAREAQLLNPEDEAMIEKAKNKIYDMVEELEELMTLGTL